MNIKTRLEKLKNDLSDERAAAPKTCGCPEIIVIYPGSVPVELCDKCEAMPARVIKPKQENEY
jgi:hypothetical protein